MANQHIEEYATPFISFVMPVYNAEHDLPATLHSIIAQDDGRIEIVCVDDGSRDSSGKILDEAAQQHSCITVIHQENQGITAARNAGLAAATGTWICFVDNDDIVAQDAVSVIHQTAQSDCDIVYYNFQRFSEALPDQSGNHLGESHIVSGADITHLQSDCINRFRDNTPLIPHSVLPTPWAKIYRRDFLTDNNLRFRNEVTHEEDIVFNFEVLSHVTAAKIVDYTLYYYRWSVYSESHRYRPHIFDSCKTTLATYRDIIARCYPNRPDIAELYEYRVLWELQYCVFLGPMHEHNPHNYRERKQEFRALRDYPPFAKACDTLNTHRFERRQALLATLIKYRCFLLLFLMGKVIGRIR